MRYKIRDARYENGSALILAVVLTSLLAIVGVLFVMTARVDKIATSAISEHRELDLAIDAVIARIAQELVLDVPDPCRLDEEYYDYPDLANRWLASLEPYEVGPGAYRWLYLTDLYDVIYNMFPQRRRIDMPVDIAPDYQDPAYVSNSSELRAADADGDGVADSVWAELPNITSGKGRTIYAAVRVIDNSAMINVNTAYKFDDAEGLERIDGSSQMQINLAGLSLRGANGTLAEAADVLHVERCGTGQPDLLSYKQNVVWRYYEPSGLYTPFDISDELELRNRFLLNQRDTYTRIEQIDWTRAFLTSTTLDVPRNLRDHSISDPSHWFWKANNSSPDVNEYDYRHISTTYNMDRIISPDGGKMANVNIADKYALRNRITTALLNANPGFVDVSAAAAQIAANLIDFRDADEFVTAVNDVDNQTYYGFERPCVYISELVHNYVSDVNSTGRSYAIELYKPYFEDEDPVGWQLVIDNPPSPPRVVDVNWSGTRRFHVIEWQDPNALLSVSFIEPNSPNPFDGAMWVDPEVVLSWPVRPWAASYDLYLGSSANDVNLIASDLNDTSFDITEYAEYDPNGLKPETVYYWRVDDDVNKGDVWMFTTAPSGSGYSSPTAQVAGGWSPGQIVFDVGSIIKLQRVAENGVPVVVDSIRVPDWLVAGGLRSFQRDITLHKCIRRLWDDSGIYRNSLTLGYSNIYPPEPDPDPAMIQAHPENTDFVGIGDVGKIFAVDASGIGPDDMEEDVRINLADPNYQRIFNYLTVFDPTSDTIDNDGDGRIDIADVNTPEWKVPGRININTAPWYIIAQLPWMTPEIAQAIAFYRHTPQGPFESIGELNNVVDVAAPLNSIDYYGRADGPAMGDEIKFPDLTPQDEAADDFEERDLIFARISNLVTVRSDVFTAYILVRIGPDGPQKRVIAILDRSDVYADGTGGVTGRVRVRALHPVPDPR